MARSVQSWIKISLFDVCRNELPPALSKSSFKLPDAAISREKNSLSKDNKFGSTIALTQECSTKWQYKQHRLVTGLGRNWIGNTLMKRVHSTPWTSWRIWVLLKSSRNVLARDQGHSLSIDSPALVLQFFWCSFNYPLFHLNSTRRENGLKSLCNQ